MIFEKEMEISHYPVVSYLDAAWGVIGSRGRASAGAVDVGVVVVRFVLTTANIGHQIIYMYRDGILNGILVEIFSVDIGVVVVRFVLATTTANKGHQIIYMYWDGIL